MKCPENMGSDGRWWQNGKKCKWASSPHQRIWTRHDETGWERMREENRQLILSKLPSIEQHSISSQLWSPLHQSFNNENVSIIAYATFVSMSLRQLWVLEVIVENCVRIFLASVFEHILAVEKYPTCTWSSDAKVPIQIYISPSSFSVHGLGL